MAVARKKTSRRMMKKTSPKSRTSMSSRSSTSRSKKVSNVKSIKSASLGQISKPFNKSELMSCLSSMTGQSRKQISDTISCLQDIACAHMKRQGPGEFTLPGLLKMKTKHKPATKARKGINPFTGEPTVFKARPARNMVKILALKKLKESAK